MSRSTYKEILTEEYIFLIRDYSQTEILKIKILL